MIGKAHYKKGPKYVYYDEIRKHHEVGQSVVLIRFRGRVTTDDCVKQSYEILSDHGVIQSGGYAVEFATGRHSIYFILPTKEHKAILGKALENFFEQAPDGLFHRSASYDQI